MRCRTIFDILAVGYRAWWFPVAILVVCGSALLINNVVDAQPSRPTFRRWFDVLFVVGGLGLAGVAFWGTYSDYATLRDAVRTGRYVVVEGIVSDFTPADSGDHIPETFSVNGHRYSYSWSKVVPSFNRTTPHGGPIREGLRVRIYDVGGQIARLEVCDSSMQ